MDKHDNQDIYCRMLGHNVSFEYCRKAKESLPCSRMINCWFERLPINEYLNEHFSEEELKQAFSPPKEKIATIIELIEKAKNRV